MQEKKDMQLKLAGMFSDHMVLQRDLPVAVWGWAAAGKTVKVSLAGHTAQAVADADGSWRVTLPALSARGPY